MYVVQICDRIVKDITDVTRKVGFADLQNLKFIK